MRRRNRVGSRFVIGLIVLIVLCLLSALYSGVTGKPSPVSRVVSFVTTPVQRLVSGVSGAFGKGLGYFTEFDDLKAENEELKKQLREMEQTVRDAELALEENAQLRAAAQDGKRRTAQTLVREAYMKRVMGIET